jgi:hypothetical protein
MDFSKGTTFVQNGILYYSPNCTRPVVIPPQTNHTTSPFNVPRLSASLFRQPIWWSSLWGWVGFIPMAPSFISIPFEPFCWMPVIEKHAPLDHLPTRYRMRQTDVDVWKAKEDLVICAARLIKLKYGISAMSPPRPLSFGYDQYHKSANMTRRLISVTRNWFGIWMGFLSYLVARSQTDEYNQGDPNTPVPCWYQHLLTHGFSDA